MAVNEPFLFGQYAGLPVRDGDPLTVVDVESVAALPSSSPMPIYSAADEPAL
ncbi:hypothetical protein QA646_29625 (plasmid) [Rhizobium sp. CB3090]|uniref:hypothetical protein n=1 Tax=Rhizobium sp. CB3090 TaxID=3039156 RepID=UPI0024B1C106|nr:hypothetical protein [Rhizobium sp. CB3090]WFU13367.1 hypothetical protein QA646_29625 [Rhizobium sp. CB3090]